MTSKKWRCKHCIHHQVCYVEGVKMLYCLKQDRYCPPPKFVEPWGCGDYVEDQLKLFE